MESYGVLVGNEIIRIEGGQGYPINFPISEVINTASEDVVLMQLEQEICIGSDFDNC